jgi:hypothetical protein
MPWLQRRSQSLKDYRRAVPNTRHSVILPLSDWLLAQTAFRTVQDICIGWPVIGHFSVLAAVRLRY